MGVNATVKQKPVIMLVIHISMCIYGTTEISQVL